MANNILNFYFSRSSSEVASYYDDYSLLLLHFNSGPPFYYLLLFALKLSSSKSESYAFDNRQRRRLEGADVWLPMKSHGPRRRRRLFFFQLLFLGVENLIARSWVTLMARHWPGAANEESLSAWHAFISRTRCVPSIYMRPQQQHHQPNSFFFLFFWNNNNLTASFLLCRDITIYVTALEEYVG